MKSRDERAVGPLNHKDAYLKDKPLACMPEIPDTIRQYLGEAGSSAGVS